MVILLSTFDKFLDMILSGKQDNNVRFKDLQTFLKSLGFYERIKGDHFIYNHDNYVERIVIQPNGNKAKPYQVKPIRQIILKYHLKKKYHRLKNGNFLSLEENEAMQFIDSVTEGIDIDYEKIEQRLKQDKVKLIEK